MNEDDFHIKKIYQRLLSSSAPFKENSGDFLARLDDITQLMELRKDHTDLGQEIQSLIICALEKIKELSIKLKELILTRPEAKNELILLQTVLEQQDTLLLANEFPYVIGYEWIIECESSRPPLLQKHTGDLILMSETYNFLVVELKFIKHSGALWYKDAKKKRIKFVCKQARKFEDLFKQRFPWAYVKSLAITNLGIYQPQTKALLQIIDYETDEEGIDEVV
jgi:hypothetical protein